MRAARPVFRLLLQEKNPAADNALVAALSCAAPDTAHAIIQTILARHQPDGLYGLIEQFHLLDEAGQQLVVDGANYVFRSLREAFNSKDDRIRINVIELIRLARLYRASYLLEAALHDRQPRIREFAANALHTLADTILSAWPQPVEFGEQTIEQQRVAMSDLESRREDRRQLASSVGTALACFGSHLQPKVVEAGMWLVDDLGIRFWTCITTPSSRALRAAVSVLEQELRPRLIPFAIEALAHAELRPHVLKIIAGRCDAEFMAEWLRQGWRLTEPRLARTMAGVKELACLQDRAAALLQAPADAERHLARWIRLSGLPNPARVAILKELFRRGGTEIRRSAIGALLDFVDESAINLLRAVASEKDSDCSHVARLELARRFPTRYPPGDLLPQGTASFALPAGARTEPPLTLERYWNEFDQLDAEQRLRIGSLVLARTPRAWAVINRQLTNPEAASRVRALRIITTLGLATSFTDQLYTLSFDQNPEVRSAAVLALGQIPNATSKRIVQQALLDPDNRVQANAVEAVEEGGHVAADALLPKLASADNRVRANAVKALLKMGVREAAQTLARMLQDPDRRQRASGLWLVEKMGLITLTDRVVQMAAADRDPQLRTRASAICDRFMRRRQ